MKKEKKDFVFPYSNRGVGNTLENGLRACVDWVEGTFKTVGTKQLITDILQMDFNKFYLDTGRYGYRKSLRCGSIAVYYDGNEDMGIHLEMRGRGCREYESYNIWSWKELFGVMLGHGASFSRLDIAVDDFKGFFKLKGIIKKIKGSELVSKFNLSHIHQSYETNTGLGQGLTIYYGSSKSDIHIRMYDKLSERINNNYNVPDDIDFWNRTEVQLRNERAQSVAEMLATNEDGERTIGKTVCGILKHYLRFTIKGKDKNRSRWKTARFWDKFLNGVDALSLSTIPIEPQTIEDKEMWFINQAAPTYALIYDAYGGDVEKMAQIAEYGRLRYKREHRDMISRFQEQKIEGSS
ncbi:replication initiation factor domain-containing protein [Ureibacillus acetophenoni]|uniref:Phage replication initiation protein n=1 Tax=Ureibacillus acetophenoni TaxID=614649 RepID=A0A285U5T2_9BACL|nr:replication initiation factor domain-containing protein [Ureibacillus acetophenoni]SOC37073.1 phage replication initiation protein [Ureibacillus acetophenoni]